MFWKVRLLSIPEISKLAREYSTVGVDEETFMKEISNIKNYLLFSKWEDFYIFL